MACAETRNFARVRTPGWREEGRETGRGDNAMSVALSRAVR